MTTTNESQIEPAKTGNRHPIAGSEDVEALGSRLTPERRELLESALRVRRSIGRIRENVADLVSEMRETGD